ncbi:phage tail protein [Sulfurirhabdus autotrophica]|uniref:Microcystin-dependent protein n=1 Tax=Sulfurirhabdus autotrophica TaxID=1706046 RepID=A0A4R3YAS3_9PROT|nr:tail fiber protein [Sulfurirhabdus autotrophica]TCV89020.1 microcystin-dependent protein [Sulfurirhabdus autotrophica]
MAQPYVGEIRMFGGNFAPSGWEFCNGQLLPISGNETLFNLIGTSYGGDGQSTFALPDLRGRIPIHQGQGAGLSSHVFSEKGGVESVTLTLAQMPAHTHKIGSGTTATLGDPGGAAVADTGAMAVYGTDPATVAMAPEASMPAGGNQPHNNLMPYQCVSFIISMFGIFPSQA